MKALLLKQWKAIVIALALVTCLGAFTDRASAGLLFRFKSTFTYTVASGADALGLAGASGTFVARFNANSIYINRFGLPEIDAVSDSIQERFGRRSIQRGIPYTKRR